MLQNHRFADGTYKNNDCIFINVIDSTKRQKDENADLYKLLL